MRDMYADLINLFGQHHVRYELIDHAPEGRTEIVSAMRGHDVRSAAKCIVLMVKIGKKVTRHVLAVVPGDARVDLDAVKQALQGTYASFASPHIAEELSGSTLGTVLPFSFRADLELMVDPSLLANEHIYFNAARLDRSVKIRTADYVAMAKPRIVAITQRQVI